MNEVRSPVEANDFYSNLCVQTGSGAHPASSPMGTGGPFSGSKARPRRDADHSPPCSAEVVNEYELYILSPLRLHRYVVGLLCFITTTTVNLLMISLFYHNILHVYEQTPPPCQNSGSTQEHVK
jgi:hypothetical protein